MAPPRIETCWIGPPLIWSCSVDPGTPRCGGMMIPQLLETKPYPLQIDPGVLPFIAYGTGGIKLTSPIPAAVQPSAKVFGGDIGTVGTRFEIFDKDGNIIEKREFVSTIQPGHLKQEYFIWALPDPNLGDYLVKTTLWNKDFTTNYAQCISIIPVVGGAPPWKEPEPPKKKWWDLVLELVIPKPLRDLLAREEKFRVIYEDVTGVLPTLEEIQRISAQITDWILPMNALSKLITGENLKGEPEEFGGVQDNLDIATSLLLIVPIGKIASIGTKVAAKTGWRGLFGLAEKMALKKATPAQIEALLRTDNFKYVLEAIRVDPRAYAKMAPKFTKETQALLSKALEKQHPRTAFKLFEKALADDAVAVKRLLGVPITTPSLKTALFGLTGIAGLIGLAYGIPFGTSWFAKEGLKEVFEIPLTDRMRRYRANPTPELKALIEADIAKIKQAIPIARDLIESVSWLWPFTKEGWDFYVENLDFEIIQFEKELAEIEVPEETEEEKWERIREEEEERRKRQREEEEIYWETLRAKEEERRKAALEESEAYWERIREETESEKAARRAEEEDYWSAILAKTEEERAARRAEEEIFWDKQREEQAAIEAERRESAESYWARIRAEEEERLKREREEEEAYWERIRLENEERDRLKREEEEAYWERIRAEEAAKVPYVPPVYVPPTVPAIPAYIPPITLPTGLVLPADVPVFPEKKSLVLNIETSGYKPWQHRIIAIGIQDPLVPDTKPLVIMHADERAMLNEFFKIVSDGNYTELIGYGLSFDYRFLLIKAMKLDINCKQFYNMDLYDTMQAAAQGKFSFVYKPQSPPKLSDLADYLWGYPKPFTDLEMIKYWKQGQFDKVIEFASSQITRILALYLLFRKITESSFIGAGPGLGSATFSANPTPKGIAESKLTIPEAHAPETWTAKCPTCMQEAEVPINLSEYTCRICVTKIKKN